MATSKPKSKAGAAMLKITTISGDGCTRTIKLEGEILAPWVKAVRWACTQHVHQAPRPVLDLSAVTYADAAGARMLLDLNRDGVEIIACSGFVRELLKGVVS
jgi:anti-anti-sigma regulatory factor